MYSSLDKSLVTWTPDRHGTKIFLFQARSSSSSAEWYTFLRGVLGWDRASELRINVPELNVNLRLENPFDILSEDDGEVDQDNAHFAQRTLEKAHAVAPNIIKTCLQMLEAAPEWSDALQKWMDHQRIGLAWKRYDRLEWIHGANEKKMCGTIAMIQSHDLELRPKQHYATTSHTRKGRVLTEPAPVEGFLVRLTSQKGQHQRMGKLFFKRLYFLTCDHYLFFSRPKNADPPPPPRFPSTATGSMPSSRAIADQIPIIYAVNPYPIKDGEIEWMDSPLQVVERHDRDAYNEMVRKVNMIENCDGFIDLCDVVKVRKVHRGAAEADELIDDDSEMDSDGNVSDSTEDDSQANGFDDDRTFELKLKNGLVIRLQAYDKQTRKEWKSRLRELIRYWKKRHAQDILLYKEIRTQNLQELQVDEEGEAILGQFAKKWELGLTHASPELYNMCGISCCRTIHMSGPLYRKPRLHGTFMSVQCILVPGSLLLFETALRTRTGQAILHIHHSKIQKIDLADCYLYSGLLTEGDLLYQNRTFDSNSPGHHALPRMWPEDGWNSRDEDVMTCFVLWRPSGKSWFRAPGEGKVARLKRVSALGRKGNRIVFRARSRAERDHWVLAIAAEIERSLGKEDVRVESHES
jgi:Pleckstrin homology domain